MGLEVPDRVRGHEVGVVDHFLDGRGVLILLDGLDEVSQSRIPIAAQAISILMQRLRERPGHNRLIVTMREQCHRITDQTLAEQFPVVGRFDAFTGNDIFEYLCRWPWSADTHLARGGDAVANADQTGLPLHSVAIANNVFKLLARIFRSGVV